MDSLVFHLDADKVSPNLLESIRAYFGNRRIKITVSPEEAGVDDVNPTPAADQDVVLPYDDIARIVGALERGESIDINAEMKKFGVDK